MSIGVSIPAVLLVGGQGSRLRSVLPSVPKPLAAIGERPFLELLISQLKNQGIRRVVMCTGFLAAHIEDRFGDGAQWGITISYSREPKPFGTAGALKFAAPCLRNDDQFFVLNGDSFLDVDFEQLIRFHRRHGGLISMSVVRVSNAGRYGTVAVAPDGRVHGFFEKTFVDQPGVINAGVYVFNRAVLDYIAEMPASLERDLFPYVLAQGVYASEQSGMFIDIGTPEDYSRAQSLSGELRAVAFRANETLRRAIQREKG